MNGPRYLKKKLECYERVYRDNIENGVIGDISLKDMFSIGYFQGYTAAGEETKKNMKVNLFINDDGFITIGERNE